MVTEELRALAPDVIALQEASRTRRAGVVARRLAESLGYQYVFEPATTRLTPITPLNRLIVTLLGFAEGLAVVTRFPIASSEVYELPVCRNRIAPRILLRVDVATPWGPFPVFNTHTSSEPCQVERITEIVRDARLSGPFVVTGDFNMTETSETMQSLRRWGRLIDAFRTAHPDASGATVYQRPWAATSTVSRRVDFILVGGLQDAGRSVCGSRVIADTPRRYPDGRTLWASDHYGVLADLDVFGIKCAP